MSSLDSDKLCLFVALVAKLTREVIQSRSKMSDFDEFERLLTENKKGEW